MRLYKRADFIKLPAGTIYSRVEKDTGELMAGLYCKTSGPDMTMDWVEQNLISEPGFPHGIKDGSDALDFQLSQRDSFQYFETDLDCAGRDGMFEESDVFVVWGQYDVMSLIIYLQNALKQSLQPLKDQSANGGVTNNPPQAARVTNDYYGPIVVINIKESPSVSDGCMTHVRPGTFEEVTLYPGDDGYIEAKEELIKKDSGGTKK